MKRMKSLSSSFLSLFFLTHMVEVIFCSFMLRTCTRSPLFWQHPHLVDEEGITCLCPVLNKILCFTILVLVSVYRWLTSLNRKKLCKSIIKTQIQRSGFIRRLSLRWRGRKHASSMIAFLSTAAWEDMISDKMVKFRLLSSLCREL